MLKQEYKIINHRVMLNDQGVAYFLNTSLSLYRLAPSLLAS